MRTRRERALVSPALRLAVLQYRANGGRLYELANAVELHPNVLSMLLHGIRPVWPDDPRVKAIGKFVGVRAADCFVKVRRRVTPAATASATA